MTSELLSHEISLFHQVHIGKRTERRNGNEESREAVDNDFDGVDRDCWHFISTALSLKDGKLYVLVLAMKAARIIFGRHWSSKN